MRFECYKPELFNLSNMVEVQVSFHVVRVGRHDYVFVPKLRALCLLNRNAEAVCLFCYTWMFTLLMLKWGRQDYNIAAIEAIAKGPVSPLKKIKRKVGYEDHAEEENGDNSDEPPRAAMKRLCLGDSSVHSSHEPSTDDPMSPRTP